MYDPVTLSPLAQSLKPGLYKHYKGDPYRVLGVAHNAQDTTQEFVIYQNQRTMQFWVRPPAIFLENVDKDGYKGPRFTYVGE